MKLILLAGLLATCIHAESQSIANRIPNNSPNFLKKAKVQKGIGWVILGGGVALTGAGAIVSSDNGYFDITWNGRGGPANQKTGAGWYVAGGVAIFSSIPFFIAASKNEKKAMPLIGRIKMESTLNPSLGNVKSTYPAVAIILPLK